MVTVSSQSLCPRLSITFKGMVVMVTKNTHKKSPTHQQATDLFHKDACFPQLTTSAIQQHCFGGLPWPLKELYFSKLKSTAIKAVPVNRKWADLQQLGVFFHFGTLSAPVSHVHRLKWHNSSNLGFFFPPWKAA